MNTSKKITQDSSKLWETEILDSLERLGADWYDLLLPESHALPDILHKDEQMAGIVYGQYSIAPSKQKSRGALVATSTRVLILNKKPRFLKCEEIIYSVISGITYAKVGIETTITLHTRMGDISIKTLNERCASTFVDAIEVRIFKEAPSASA